MILLSVHPSIRLSAQDTLPVGLGTIKRDDIVLRFATDQLQIQVLPLDESVIRLLAPDTYRSLAELIRSKRAAIDSAAQGSALSRPVLFLVTFFGNVSQARFTPEDLNVTSRGRLFRPIAMVPLSPTWNGQQLEIREQAVAIYVFEEGISFREPLTVSYQGLSNDAWARFLRVLDQERARVLARAQQVRPNP